MEQKNYIGTFGLDVNITFNSALALAFALCTPILIYWITKKI